MKEFFKQYRKMQQTLVDIHYASNLLKGDEWVLKQENKPDDYQSFWIDHVDTLHSTLIYQRWDGGGHCRQNSIDMKKFTERHNQTTEEREVWLNECRKICEEMIAKKKDEYEDRSLNSGLQQIKWAILERDKETAQHVFDELMKKIRN